MIIRAVVHKPEEGGFWAGVPALPGCMSQGESLDELRVNVREAVEAWFEAGEAERNKGSGDQILELAMRNKSAGRSCAKPSLAKGGGLFV
jgi:predicted RNase H-like HicB family nuclease